MISSEQLNIITAVAAQKRAESSAFDAVLAIATEGYQSDQDAREAVVALTQTLADNGITVPESPPLE